MLIKVISGGQIGSDIAALRAAKKYGFLTGGWLPKGCITLQGSNPSLIQEFSMQEHVSSGYPPRTEANVRDSDATLRIAVNFKSKGEICTLKAIKWYKKPHLDIDVKNPLSIDEVVCWLTENKVRVLNVAGNADVKVGEFAEQYLGQIFETMRND
jgi:hypothetical protein